MTQEKETEVDLLDEARQRTAHLTAHLPERIQIGALTLNSKLPFKAVELREALFHRMCQLSAATVDQLEADRAVPATLLSRASMETFALMYALHVKLKSFLEKPDVRQIDEFFMNSLFGSRSDPQMPQATNILKHIDRVDKLIPAFRAGYDALSEYAHPNWSGVMGSFSKVDRGTFEVHLGPRQDSPWKAQSLHIFTATLMGFEDFYNKIADQLYAFNDHFEKNESGA